MRNPATDTEHHPGPTEVRAALDAAIRVSADPRAADLADHLRALVVEREARRAALAADGSRPRLHAYSSAPGVGDPELARLDDQLHRALADAEDQCRSRFHDAFQAIAALDRRTAPAVTRAVWDDLADGTAAAVSR